jgi:hypothetical protein
MRQPTSSCTKILVGTKTQLCGLKGHNQNCAPDDLDAVHIVSEEQWRDYFVLSVIRNPWIQKLNAYNIPEQALAPVQSSLALVPPSENRWTVQLGARVACRLTAQTSGQYRVPRSTAVVCWMSSLENCPTQSGGVGAKPRDVQPCATLQGHQPTKG